MKVIYLILLVFVCSSCTNKHHDQIEAEIKMVEARRGHNIVSYEIISQKDSTDKWYVVDYTAIVDGHKKSSGHLIFSSTADGLLSR